VCKSIPSHETLITKTQAVVKSCQNMTQKCAGHKRRVGGEEDEEEKKMIMIIMTMRTFLQALTCTCRYIRNVSFVSEDTAGLRGLSQK